MELTRLQRREVVDGDGRRVGTVADVAVSLAETYPAVTHVLVRTASVTAMSCIALVGACVAGLAVLSLW